MLETLNSAQTYGTLLVTTCKTLAEWLVDYSILNKAFINRLVYPSSFNPDLAYVLQFMLSKTVIFKNS